MITKWKTFGGKFPSYIGCQTPYFGEDLGNDVLVRGNSAISDGFTVSVAVSVVNYNTETGNQALLNIEPPQVNFILPVADAPTRTQGPHTVNNKGEIHIVFFGTIIQKYDDMGNLLWTVDMEDLKIDRTGSAFIIGIQPDQFGNVWVFGNIGVGLGQAARFGTFTSLKLNGNGEPIDAFNSGCILDPNDPTFCSTYSVQDMIDSIGTTQSNVPFISDGSIEIPTGQRSTWALDRFDNLYITVTFGEISNILSYRLLKIDSDFNLVWSIDTGFVRPVAVVDLNGNVYVRGNRINNTTHKKYDSDGNLLWSADHGGAVTGITVDKEGNVFIIGQRISGVTTRKYDTNGNLLWSIDYGGTANSSFLQDLAVDKAGNLYTVGRTIGINLNSIRKYDPAGNLLWSASNPNINEGSLHLLINTFPPNKGPFLGDPYSCL